MSLLVWKIEPCAHQLVAKLAGVDEVAVVADGNLPVRAVDQERLRVLDACSRPPSNTACGRWPDGPAALSSVCSLKASATWPIARDSRMRSPSAGGDAGALLPAMLQRVEAEVGEVGGLGMPEDAENAALVFEFVAWSLAPSALAVLQSPVYTCGARSHLRRSAFTASPACPILRQPHTRMTAFPLPALSRILRCSSSEVPAERRRPELLGFCHCAVNGAGARQRSR